jgi:hypothetical protein
MQNARGPRTVGTAATLELQTHFPGTSAINIAHLFEAFKRVSWLRTYETGEFRWLGG